MNRRLLVALGVSLLAHLIFIFLPYTAPDPRHPEPETLVVDLHSVLEPAGESEEPGPAAEEPLPEAEEVAEAEVEEPVEEEPAPEPEPEPEVEEPAEEPEEKVVEEEAVEEEVAEPEEEPEAVEEELEEPAEEREDEPPEGLRREPLFRRAERSNNYRDAGQPGGEGERGEQQEAAPEEFERYAVREPEREEPADTYVFVPLPELERDEFERSELRLTDVSRSSPEIDLDDEQNVQVLEAIDPDAGTPGRPRQRLKNPLPEAPDWLEETGERTRLVVSYKIQADGEVNSVEVLGSSGYPELDALVVNYIQRWEYEPAADAEGRMLEIHFELRS